MTEAGPVPAGRYPVAAMTAIVLASLVVLMDTTFIVLSLPEISADLDAGTGAGGGVEWAVTAFLMTTGVAQIAAGWAADRVGQRTVFLGASAAFGVFAVAVAASPGLVWLIAARCLQGACAGLMIPMATSIAFGLFPPGKRATAVGVSGTVVMLGPVIAPLLSGWILDVASWRWLMLLDLPFVAGVLVLGWHRLPQQRHRHRRPFDGLGLLLLGAGLGALLVALAQADHWPAGVTAGIGVAGAGLLGLYVLHARRAAHPLIDLRIFTAPAFGVVIGIVATVAVAQFARTVFVPLELQGVRGLSPLDTGLVLVPSALAAAIAMPIGGRWTDRTGGRAPVTVGLMLAVISSAALGLLQVDTPLALIVLLLVTNNVGIVLCSMPVTVMGLSAVAPRLVPQAAALRSLTRQVSGALGTAVLATIITAQVGDLTFATATADELQQAQRAYNVGFLLSAAIAGVGLVLARMLPADNSVRSTSEAEEEGTWLTS